MQVAIQPQGTNSREALVMLPNLQILTEKVQDFDNAVLTLAANVRNDLQAPLSGCNGQTQNCNAHTNSIKFSTCSRADAFMRSWKAVSATLRG